MENTATGEFALAGAGQREELRGTPRISCMRARSVALDCGAGRSVVGAFDLTPDGDLVLVDRAFCTLMECGPDGARAQLPDWALRGRVVLASPAHRTMLKSVAVPQVGGGQREAVLRFEAGQIAGGALAESLWSHVPVSDDLVDREIVAVLKSAVGVELCAMVERHGLVADRIVPAGWALVRALRHNYPELAGPVVVVWLDGRSALLLRVERTDVVQRLVGLPGRGPGVEREVVSVGASAPARLRVESGGPSHVAWMDRMAVEIARLADVGSPPGSERAEVQVFLGGDGDVGPETVALLAARAGVPVSGLDALRRVRSRIPGVATDAVALQLGVVVGLALAAGDEPGLDVLPPGRRRENRFRRTRGRWLVATAGLVALLVVAWAWMRQERLISEREDAVVAAWLVPQRVAEQQEREGESERDRLRRQLAALSAIGAARTGWLEWFVDLQERLTQAEDLWLESLAVRPQTAPGAAVAGPELLPGGLRISLAGCVLRQAGSDPIDRVRRLRMGLLASRFVAAVEDERFDDTQPGLLRFGCTLVMKPEVAL